MNKKNQQLIVPLVFGFSILLFIFVFGMIVRPNWDNYNDKVKEKDRIVKENKDLEARYEDEKAKSEQQKIKLQSIKQVYETNINSKNDNLSVYGTMFDEIIKKAQANELGIRSIEYNTKPENNEILNNFSSGYNVCELKFFFVGTYPQLRSFLNDLSVNFQYLISISNLDVTAFTGDTNYLLIKMSIILYSKKAAETQSM